MANHSSSKEEESVESLPTVNTLLLSHAFSIVKEARATVLFVYCNALPKDFQAPEPEVAERICYITRSPRESREQTDLGNRFIQVPGVPLTRIGQIKMAILFSMSKGILKSGQRVVCLSGPSSSADDIDTILVIDVGKEFELFLSTKENGLSAKDLLPAVLERVIDIAADLATEGREGKPIGALFVLGDTQRVLSMSQQMILNPFRGYPEEDRNIMTSALEETVKELAMIDGAFLIRADGVIESAGTYLKAGSSVDQELPQGLGARHQAASAITSLSESIAITVSESTGTVTIFRHGQIITEIQRPYRGRPVGVEEE